jgi:hypothetical protein
VPGQLLPCHDGGARQRPDTQIPDPAAKTIAERQPPHATGISRPEAKIKIF